ncbi:DUF547 domain-containing protein [Parerythrobacter aestuarii]|uniref:DUF547 domain-containing protein n=1 Tax=Parerythrobacter aestuarii TaxID=3020909 RepID=UPI0024DE6257|nr:DUF547 domain-containing protein [Parerythrobacter aestuarii]
MPRKILLAALSAGAALSLIATVPASAQSAASASDASFAQFTPKADMTQTSLDYTVWDEALRYVVFRMGRSSRQAAPSVEVGLSGRIKRGHHSRYRLEGNRVIFSFLEQDIKDSLLAYKQDLESVASQVDIASLPRNEQLAYWINLHNAAVIAELAQQYPVRSPSLGKFGPDNVSLDEAKVITVNGVAMSPRDIRTKIVYPNWQDPKVIYGFFRGEIGGPSIPGEAFTAANVSRLLADNAREFVNSLRGVEKIGSTMHVSKIYEEARPFYFGNWEADLRAHIDKYARLDVADVLEKTTRSEASLYETDISDLAGGQREPSYSNIQTLGEDGMTSAQSTRVPSSVARLILEHRRKINELIRRKELTPRVIVIDMNSSTGEGYEVE